jgi:hypothetical protein
LNTIERQRVAHSCPPEQITELPWNSLPTLTALMTGTRLGAKRGGPYDLDCHDQGRTAQAMGK